LPRVVEPSEEEDNAAASNDDDDDDDSPSVSKTGLRWENESWAYYNPTYNPARWSKGRTLIGTVGGSAIREYGQWVVDYCTNNPG